MTFIKDPIFYFYFFLYVLIAITALNFNYIEGDDAYTILYHLCGRNSNIQLPYASYHSGFDFVLSFFPNKETFLRHLSIIISFISGFSLLYLLKIFITNLLRIDEKDSVLFFVTLPFMIPDFLFHSLIINPTNLSFSFALISLIAFERYVTSKGVKFAIITLISLALAIPFRWSIITVAPVFVCITLYKNNIKDVLNNFKLFGRTIGLITLSIIFGVLLIYVTGYKIKDLIDTIIWGKSYMSNTNRSKLELFASGSAFLTPGLFYTLGLGIFLNFKNILNLELRVINLTIIFLLSILPFFILGFYPSLKQMITVIPILILILFLAYKSFAKYRLAKTLWIISIFLPWIIGIKLQLNGSFYGPGFEVLNYNKPQNLIKVNERNLDERIRIQEFHLGFSGGCYMPTAEGPRPLYGYFNILFCGEWYKQIQLHFEERNKIFNLIKSNKFNIHYYQDRKTAFFQTDLFRFGFWTELPFKKKNGIDEREFFSKKDTISIKIVPDKNNTVDWIINETKKTKYPLIFKSSYTSLIFDLKQKNNDFIIMGPNTALWLK